MPLHAPTRPHWLIAVLSLMVALLTGCGPQGDSTPAVSVLGIISQYSLTGRPISTLQVKATSKDGKTLSYAASGLPPGISLDPASGNITGTATTVGTYPVAVTVATESGKSSRNFTWNIYSDALVVTRSGGQIRLAGYDTFTGTTGWCFKASDTSTPSSTDACWQTTIAKAVAQQLPLPVYTMWTRDGSGNISAPISGPCSSALMAAATQPSVVGPVVCLVTSAGELAVELDDQRAPLSSGNFLAYVNDGFYDGTVFHRILGTPGAAHPIGLGEAGAYTYSGGNFNRKVATYPPVAREATGLLNLAGSVGLVPVYDSTAAVFQLQNRFFINFVDNPSLDSSGNALDPNSLPLVFGKVIYDAGTTLTALRATPVINTVAGEPSQPSTPPVIGTAFRVK